MPQVNIAVVGRFHAFDLARELDARGMLSRLQTTYPTWLTKRWGLPSTKTANQPQLEALLRINRKLRLFDQGRVELTVHRAHARRAARTLVQNADVFIGWSGSSLEALIAARDTGAITILERGSSHCSSWRALMLEENGKIGRAFDPMYEFWQRELLEYELADYISIPSMFVRDTFIANGVNPKKLLVNNYGVDLRAFRQIEKEDDVFRIINVGGFSVRKGSRYLLQSFAELDLPNAELWHVGTVNPEMRPIIEKYRNDKVVFHGHKPQAELYKYYSQASVFALTSVEEGLAMVQPQAMACGLPIICTTNTGGADLIGDDGEAGYVVPIRDVEALKARILHLYRNRELTREMGRKAKSIVSHGFAWADYGARYADNLRKIVDVRRGSR